MICDCAEAGYCPVFKKTMSPRHHQICRGEVLTPDMCEAYRQNWRSFHELAAAAKVMVKTTASNSGPGTELGRILRTLGVQKKSGCLCDARMAEMDRRGVEGCRQTRAEILGWLREGYDEADVLTKFSAWTVAIVARLPVTLAGLLDLAIERAAQDVAPAVMN